MSYTVPNKALLSQLTASNHVSASAFYGDGSNLTNISASGITTVNYLDFNTNIDPSFNIGRLHYGSASGDLEFDIANNGTTLNIGQQLIVKVKNNTASTIEKGKVVKVSGSQGSSDVLYIVTASWENDPGSADTIGFTMTQLASNEIGYVILEGVLPGLDTSMYSAGQMVYLSSSGDITPTRPTPPYHAVRLGHIARVNTGGGNVGSIFVHIQNGYELDELHDVLITSPQSYDLLVRDTDGLWKNSKILSGSYNFTNTQIIDASSSNTALRITQRGTGLALRVEDSINPDLSCFVVDSDGKVGIGTNATASAALSIKGSAIISGDISTSTANGLWSFSQGTVVQASGNSSHAEGSNTIASGNSSHAEGSNTIASGNYSHAEGSITIASGDNSHAEGELSVSIGIGSHAEGYQTNTQGDFSHAEGMMTTASADYQHVQGKYNLTSSTALMIVGNGTHFNNRKNILEIYTGSVVVSGSMYLTDLLSQTTSSKISSSPGSIGQICWDSNYIYVCTGTNTWKSSSLN